MRAHPVWDHARGSVKKDANRIDRNPTTNLPRNRWYTTASNDSLDKKVNLEQNLRPHRNNAPL